MLYQKTKIAIESFKARFFFYVPPNSFREDPSIQKPNDRHCTLQSVEQSLVHWHK